jgi:hypothetical protein
LPRELRGARHHRSRTPAPPGSRARSAAVRNGDRILPR